jgi:ribosome-binding protein aMBF1 (putative translation factor)
MGWICEHCGVPFVGLPHRVKSEESGIVLLDLIVCQYCYMVARQLGLRTEEIQPEPPLESEMKKA